MMYSIFTKDLVRVFKTYTLKRYYESGFDHGGVFLYSLWKRLRAKSRELRAISIILPQTYALKGIRVALIPGVTLSQILPHLKALVIFSIILVPVGLVMLKYSLNLERKRGAIY